MSVVKRAIERYSEVKQELQREFESLPEIRYSCPDLIYSNGGFKAKFGIDNIDDSNYISLNYTVRIDPKKDEIYADKTRKSNAHKIARILLENVPYKKPPVVRLYLPNAGRKFREGNLSTELRKSILSTEIELDENAPFFSRMFSLVEKDNKYNILYGDHNYTISGVDINDSDVYDTVLYILNGENEVTLKDFSPKFFGNCDEKMDLKEMPQLAITQPGPENIMRTKKDVKGANLSPENILNIARQKTKEKEKKVQDWIDKYAEKGVNIEEYIDYDRDILVFKNEGTELYVTVSGMEEAPISSFRIYYPEKDMGKVFKHFVGKEHSLSVYDKENMPGSHGRALEFPNKEYLNMSTIFDLFKEAYKIKKDRLVLKDNNSPNMIFQISDDKTSFESKEGLNMDDFKKAINIANEILALPDEPNQNN